MNTLLPASPRTHCQADPHCRSAPCFQARIEGNSGHRSIRTRTELCAEHLGDAVQTLAAWGREQGLEGEVTVLAVDRPRPGQIWPSWGRNGLLFTKIELTGHSKATRQEASSIHLRGYAAY
jgi:hypothetical protein